MKLNYEIVEIKDLSEHTINEMFQLLAQHYVNVTQSDFISDLTEKQWVILLFTTDSHNLVGFSTQMCISGSSENDRDNHVVIYSGDTIIAHEYWGSLTLPVSFLNLVSRVKILNPNKKIYWLLISKGLRTFKFLSVFINEYYPHPERKTPSEMQKLMDYYGKFKFGNRYNAQRGIVAAHEGDQYLKDEFQPDERSDKAVAKFFYTANPGYYKGDELLCLAEISDENLHPFIKRIVSGHV